MRTKKSNELSIKKIICSRNDYLLPMIKKTMQFGRDISEFGISAGVRSIILDDGFNLKIDQGFFEVGLIPSGMIPYSVQSFEDLKKFLTQKNAPQGERFKLLNLEDAFFLRGFPQFWFDGKRAIVYHEPRHVQEDLDCFRILSLHKDKRAPDSKPVDFIGTLFPRDLFEKTRDYYLVVGLTR